MLISTDSRGAADAGDVAELYSSLSGRLERIVRLGVRAQDAVVEDACQFAWSRLVDHGDRVKREAALSWLATTAVHEAIRLLRREHRELSLDATLERHGDAGLAAPALAPHDLLEHRERLESIRGLPERQQRLLWLLGFGMTYAEMALHTGATTRTVERQLLRAKHRIRRVADE
jgi:RNA polymerase sigma factor (sigma-70 family)